ASDDLASGQSTFMVEMNEVAGIMKNATSKSLLILDEIGRGTSTFDGMSIARAVIEYAASEKLSAKTLFATHYHELTALEGRLDGVKNYNIAVKKRGDDIIFLRRIVRGGTDDSYGIEVAKLAGVPQKVIDRAKEILQELESGRGTQTEVVYTSADEEEITFTGRAKDEFVEMIKRLDVDTLTPIESMNLLYKIKEEAKGL
ncbi:MAG: DNA mismatch repair protein MutS, partial [Clostridia bacterium]|nr:DNA mismatch repair protein MutS [Clostridia bacterium]